MGWFYSQSMVHGGVYICLYIYTVNIFIFILYRIVTTNKTSTVDLHAYSAHVCRVSFWYLSTLFVGCCNYRTIWQCFSFQTAVSVPDGMMDHTLVNPFKAIDNLGTSWRETDRNHIIHVKSEWFCQIILTLNRRNGIYPSFMNCSWWLLTHVKGQILLSAQIPNRVIYVNIHTLDPKIPPIFWEWTNIHAFLRKKQIRSLEFFDPMVWLKNMRFLPEQGLGYHEIVANSKVHLIYFLSWNPNSFLQGIGENPSFQDQPTFALEGLIKLHYVVAT